MGDGMRDIIERLKLERRLAVAIALGVLLLAWLLHLLGPAP